MSTFYGFSLVKWEAAKDQAPEILNSVARLGEGQTITYSDLARQITAISIEPHDYAMATLLGEISTDDHDHGRGMRSALVVSVDEGLPGSGYFPLAKGTREDTTDETKFWLGELKKSTPT